MIPKPCKPKLLALLVIAVLAVLPTDVLTASADEENHNEDMHDDKAKFYAGRSKRGYKYKPWYEAQTTTDWINFMDKLEVEPSIKPRIDHLPKENHQVKLSPGEKTIISFAVMFGLISIIFVIDWSHTRMAIRRKHIREALVRNMEMNEHMSEHPELTSAPSNSDNRDRENNANSYTIPIIFTEDLQLNSKEPNRFMGHSTSGPAALHLPMGCPVDPSSYRTVYGAP